MQGGRPKREYVGRGSAKGRAELHQPRGAVPRTRKSDDLGKCASPPRPGVSTASTTVTTPSSATPSSASPKKLNRTSGHVMITEDSSKVEPTIVKISVPLSPEPSETIGTDRTYDEDDLRTFQSDNSLGDVDSVMLKIESLMALASTQLAKSGRRSNFSTAAARRMSDRDRCTSDKRLSTATDRRHSMDSAGTTMNEMLDIVLEDMGALTEDMLACSESAFGSDSIVSDLQRRLEEESVAAREARAEVAALREKLLTREEECERMRKEATQACKDLRALASNDAKEHAKQVTLLREEVDILRKRQIELDSKQKWNLQNAITLDEACVRSGLSAGAVAKNFSSEATCPAVAINSNEDSRKLAHALLKAEPRSNFNSCEVPVCDAPLGKLAHALLIAEPRSNFNSCEVPVCDAPLGKPAHALLIAEPRKNKSCEVPVGGKKHESNFMGGARDVHVVAPASAVMYHQSPSPTPIIPALTPRTLASPAKMSGLHQKLGLDSQAACAAAGTFSASLVAALSSPPSSGPRELRAKSPVSFLRNSSPPQVSRALASSAQSRRRSFGNSCNNTWASMPAIAEPCSRSQSPSSRMQVNVTSSPPVATRIGSDAASPPAPIPSVFKTEHVFSPARPPPFMEATSFYPAAKPNAITAPAGSCGSCTVPLIHGASSKRSSSPEAARLPNGTQAEYYSESAGGAWIPCVVQNFSNGHYALDINPTAHPSKVRPKATYGGRSSPPVRAKQSLRWKLKWVLESDGP